MKRSTIALIVLLVIAGAALLIACNVIDRQPLPTSAPTVVSQPPATVAATAAADPSPAVSYTHLDVYKRQMTP